MSNYRKLIAAFVGIAVFVGQQYGFDLGGVEGLIVDLIISGLTLFGVWRVPNEKAV